MAPAESQPGSRAEFEGGQVEHLDGGVDTQALVLVQELNRGRDRRAERGEFAVDHDETDAEFTLQLSHVSGPERFFRVDGSLPSDFQTGDGSVGNFV